MCGIFGAINLKGFFDHSAYDQFVKLTDLVRYRGPDDCGYLKLSLKQNQICENGSFDVFLGLRRLSIIDLSSAGHQPMTEGKGRWIVFNGEIFNYVELRQELMNKGHCFITNTDTEVILHIYDEYGEDGFEKLNGMWAFTIADVPRRRVLLSRDRFSIKPLYFMRLDQVLYFASEIKQLLPLMPKREVNAEVMSAFLGQSLVDHSPETFFRGITRVPAKTNLVICMDTGKTRVHQYWDYTTPQPVRPDDVIETFRELLLDSIGIRLRSDVKLGVLLSGGLDSSTIAVGCQQLADGKVNTYSVVSLDERYSEETFIDELSEAAGIRNHKFIFRTSAVLEALEAAIYHSDEPFGGFSVLAQYKILQMVKQQTGTTVLLSGQGGDEILLGYLKFFYFNLLGLARGKKYRKMVYELFWSLLHRTAVIQFRISLAKRYMPFWTEKNQNGHLKLPCSRVPIWECADLRARQILDIDLYSVPALTHYEDRNSMAHSLEIRNPFLDHRLVDLAVNLPVDWKLRNGWSKYILRKGFPELPEKIRWRKDKQGFLNPEEIWLKREFSPLIRKTFRKSTLGEMGILDDNGFLEYYETFLNGGSDIWYAEISRMLIAEMWAQRTFR